MEQPPAAAAMVLKKKIVGRGSAAPLCILYVPKGPLLTWRAAPIRRQVLDDLQALARREHAVFLKIDPDIETGRGIPGDEAAREDPASSNCGRTQAAPLALLQRSDPVPQYRDDRPFAVRGRYAVADEAEDALQHPTRGEEGRPRARSGTASELPMLYRMYAETSRRDGFVIRIRGLLHNVWQTFMRPQASPTEPSAEALIAEVEGESSRRSSSSISRKRAYYLYGMSREAHRDKMPNQLLQWEAMRRAKRQGCRSYDLWGAPDEFSENDPLWGVFRFKRVLAERSCAPSGRGTSRLAPSGIQSIRVWSRGRSISCAGAAGGESNDRCAVCDMSWRQCKADCQRPKVGPVQSKERP